MTELDEQGRPEPPFIADETTTLLGFLDYQRATLAWKCRGLDAAALNTTVGVSAVTLGGLLKHAASTEDAWFSYCLHARDRHAPFDAPDREPGEEWRTAANDTPEELHALWQAAVARSRAAVAEAMAEGGLDYVAQRPWKDGSKISLRWIVVHLIEEYARHNGHADFLREAVDGETGE